ncbi:class I SAM-dependent methyltransferase [Geomesophilobacter sediminis]|uniref:Class I SAM-dependent methyltransferase n=1 Tax=Geomesophilobacter sediminis TaxID=2798584 RepID=A0A8J7S8R9_9BACT|nr:class I SAM-dependent methyltransferase [Geomesophilobacter sediminis]MBJ6727762.1 class I SAM-dependent methyltransferase [Geomesophilobacter sediminis]
MTGNKQSEYAPIKSLLLRWYEEHLAALDEEFRNKDALLQAFADAAQKGGMGDAVREALERIGGAAPPVAGESHAERVYRAHLEFEEKETSLESSLDARLRTDTANWWRHRRLWEPVFDCLSHTKNDRWLTVGDTFGSDAFQMMREGFRNVLPTSIGGTFLEDSKKRGLIAEYRVENAEALSFADGSFDWAVCREAFHHFPRPMVALYEMLRVARKGVVLIEPQDPMIDVPQYTGEPILGYEKAGNYIYTISRRELEKVVLGLDLPVLATRGLFDVYYEGVEELPASDAIPQFLEFRRQTEEGQARCAQNLQKNNYLLAIIYKQKLQEVDVTRYNGYWKITAYPGNPFLK